ncbi:YjjG family noncanonical pyrimidine nucleotidase [Streptococcus caprae]|uniref:YjjG family noncanonical pyrimidine nucleotidase n=1 Tax=Streptococcus caprae TaxID=1640501 RepID=A0ABV8CXV1_9STRE
MLYSFFLLFALDHTLLDFEVGEEVALGLLLEEMNFSDHEAFRAYYKPMNQAMWKDLEKKLITKSELVNTRFSKAFAYFGIEVDSPTMAEKFQGYMGQQGHAFAGAAELLKDLTNQGYQIYGATNGITKIQQGRMQNSPIGPYFTQVFISEQLGTQKPDALFYEKIAEQIEDFQHEEALMIGDSLTADIPGGIAAGLKTVWVNFKGQQNQTPYQADYEVRTYQELLHLLS